MPQLNSDQVASYVFGQASKKSGLVFYCLGPSLSGRTHICRHLQAFDGKSVGWAPKVHLHSCKPTDLGHEIITGALKRYAKSSGITKRKVGKWLKKGLPGVLKAGRAVIRHFVPGVPSEVDAVIDRLASAWQNQEGDQPMGFPQSDVNILLTLLGNAAEDAGSDGVLLIVDGLEELPAAGVLLIGALLQEPLKGVTVFVTVNSEFGCTSQREHATLKARLQYKSPDTIVHLIGHSRDEIAAWKLRRTGVSLPIQAAQIAFARSEDGRSGLLAPWAEDADPSPTIIEKERARLYGQLDLEYAAFSPLLRQAVVLLACYYPDSVSLPEIAGKIGQSAADFLLVRDQLISAFAMDDGPGLKLRRPAVFDFVQQRAGTAAINACWKPKTNLSTTQISVDGGNVIAQSTDQRLLTIERDLRRGAIQSAFERIEVALKLAEAGDARKAGLLRHLADVHGQRGEYQVALTQLLNALSLAQDVGEQCRLKLDVAESHFRLGANVDAIKALHWVRKRSSAANDVDLWLRSVLRSVSVLIERDRFASAVRIANATVDARSKTSPSARIECHFLRTAARAFALEDASQNNAISFAKEALRIAEHELQESRYIGNCLYGLGDVHRHRREFESAKDSYVRALTYAATNFDLQVYCYLGMGAIAISLGDENALGLALDELSQIGIDHDSLEIVIASLYARVYVALSGSRAPHIQQITSVGTKATYRRKWQHAINKALGISGEQLPKLRSNLSMVQIVL